MIKWLVAAVIFNIFILEYWQKIKKYNKELNIEEDKERTKLK